ncbi:MAG: HAMP domain-containing sensor histidine kinase [Solirubrobacterales bacterium]
MSGAWKRLGLRGRLALSIAGIVLAAFAVLFVAVRREMSTESNVIKQREHHEATRSPTTDGGEMTSLAPVEDAQSEVVRTFLVFGGVSLVAALLAGYLLAARTAAPLRRMAATAAAVDAGDLKPRIGEEPTAAVEVRTLAEGFDHMLDRLEAAFSRQRRFVADASHELRTPLTAIRGQLEVLARQPEPDGDEVRRVEGLAMREMERLERLVDDLLALASLEEAGPLRRRRLALAPYLRELARSGGSGATVGELPTGTLSADPERLRQALLNLISNARRHAGPDGRVELSAIASGELLRIRVDDDGPGIPPEERERIFARFHRVQEGRDRGSGGGGLGLPIARSIVESHGGRIWAEDSPLGGARFCVELPGFRAQLGSA